MAVFVVHVEDEVAQIGTAVDDLLQEKRDCARFADAGRAQHGEVFAQHFVDIEPGGDRTVLLQMADIDHA